MDGVLATVARVLADGGRFAFSILHPCFPGRGDDGPSSLPRTGGYYCEGWWLARNTGFRGKVGASHRMLSTYLNAPGRHGLVVERLPEPSPAEWWKAEPDHDPVPVYLVASCRKTAG